MQPQKATLDNESLLALKGIQINKPDEPTISSPKEWRPKDLSELQDCIGKFKNGDVMLIDGWNYIIHKDADGNVTKLTPTVTII